MGQTEKIFLESPHSNRRIVSARSVYDLRNSQPCRGRCADDATLTKAGPNIEIINYQVMSMLCIRMVFSIPKCVSLLIAQDKDLTGNINNVDLPCVSSTKKVFTLT